MADVMKIFCHEIVSLVCFQASSKHSYSGACFVLESGKQSGMKVIRYRVNQASKACLHEIGAIWNRYKISTDKPCVYTGPGRSALGRFFYPVSNVFTYESDPVWNCTVSGWYCMCPCEPRQLRLTRTRLDPIRMEPNCTDLV